MIERLIKLSHEKLSLLDEHTLEVIQKSFSSTIVKVGGMIVSLLVSVALGRTLGAEGLGVINLTKRIVNLLLIFTLFGMHNVLVKEIAIAFNNKKWSRIGNCMYTAYWFNGGLTLIITIIFIVLAPWLSIHVFHSPQLKIPLIIAIVAMFPMTLSRIFSSGLIGYKKIWQSNLVQNTLSAWIVGLLIVIAFFLKIKIDVISVAEMYAVGRIVVALTIGLYWKKLYNYRSKREFIFPQLFKTALPLFWVSASAIVMANTDAIVLGWLGSTRDVGLYTVAARIALLTSFLLQVTNNALSPKIASLYAEGKKNELEKMVQKVTLGLFILSIFILAVFVVFGKPILGIWGKEFRASYSILIILGMGQFVNLSTGAVGLLLMMTEHEKTLGKIALTFSIINIMFSISFVILFNSIGAAIATALTVAGFHITTLFYVEKKLKISTIPFISNYNRFKFD